MISAREQRLIDIIVKAKNIDEMTNQAVEYCITDHASFDGGVCRDCLKTIIQVVHTVSKERT